MYMNVWVYVASHVMKRIECTGKRSHICHKNKVLCIHIHTRAALNVMLPISWHWPVMSEADGGGMAVEVEPSCQYPATFCWHVTDGSRVAV